MIFTPGYPNTPDLPYTGSDTLLILCIGVLIIFLGIQLRRAR